MEIPSDTKRRRPLIGYLIAGILGWFLVVTALVFLAPRFMDDGATTGHEIMFLISGLLLGGAVYHLLWRKRVRFGLTALLIVVSLVAMVCALAVNWEYLPGTLYTDQNGFLHGTGWQRYYYDSGELMIEEHYRAGVTDRTTWYKPNGDVIATTVWDKNRVNIGYFLYQDGSIRAKMESRYSPEERMYLADENRVYYAPDGGIEREYRDGKEVTPK